MAGENDIPVVNSGVAPAAAEPAAPVVAPVVAEPAAPAAVPTVVVSQPSVAAAVEAGADKPAEAADATPERAKTLLQKFDEEAKAKADAAASPEAKPEDAKPAEAKPVEGEPAKVEAAPLTFDLPPQLKAAPEEMQVFTDLVRGASSADPKEFGQKLLDLHAKSIETVVKQISDEQWKVWNDMIAAKDKEVLGHPVLGGAGHDTAMKAVGRGRDLLLPKGKEGEFTQFLEITGAGSWPIFLEMMHRAAEIYDEPALPAPGGRPPQDSHVQKSGRFALLHDHPTSQPNGRG